MSRDPVDRSLATWLREQSTTPTYLDEIVERTRRQPQRPAWSFPERWIPMQLTMRPVYVPRQFFYLALVTLLALAAAAAVAFVGVGSRPVPPYGIAANGLVAFDRDGEILVARADGTNVSTVINSIPDARGPVFSPDGSRMTFLATVKGEHTLMVARADGSEQVALSTGISLDDLALETPASWSPDSRHVVFSGLDGEHRRLFIAAVDGSDTHVVGRSELWQIDPAWSPDGKWIAFHGYVPEEMEAAGQYRTTAGLYLVRPDGQDETRLVGGTGGSFIYRKPQWMPDPNRAVLAYSIGEPSRYDIAVFDVDAGREIKFPRNVAAELWPVWSPDGSLLAWGTSTPSIRIGRADGTIVREFPPTVDYQFVWSPDGQYLFGPTLVPGQMAVMRADGTGEPTIIELDGTSRSHWSWQRQAP